MNDVKKCVQCGNEFTPKNSPGHEQKYCSRACRNAYHNALRPERIFQKMVNEKGLQAKLEGVSVPEGHAQNRDISERSMDRVDIRGRNGSDIALDYIEKANEAKIQALEYKLKYEQLQKENSELKVKVSNLEMELDELDGDDDDGGGMLGNIFPQLVKGYAENPEAAVGLVTDLFRKLTSQ